MWIWAKWFWDTMFGLVLMPGMAAQSWTPTNSGGDDKPKQERIPVKDVSLNKASATLVVDDLEALAAAIQPANAKDRLVTWSSDNPNVATVDDKGVVTAVSLGTAKITVATSDGGKTATCIVTVHPPVFAYDVNGKVVTATRVGDQSVSRHKATLKLSADDVIYTGAANYGPTQQKR